MRYTALFLLLVMASYANGQKSKTTKSWALPNMDSVYKGTSYVSFEITTLKGEKITNASCKGKVVLFDFWFEGCAGCREEFAQMNALYDSLKNDPHYLFLAITFDDPGTLPDFISKFNLNFPVATTSEENIKRLNYRQAFPTKVILNKEGKVAYTGMLRISDKDDAWDMSVNTVLSKMRQLK